MDPSLSTISTMQQISNRSKPEFPLVQHKIQVKVAEGTLISLQEDDHRGSKRKTTGHPAGSVLESK